MECYLPAISRQKVNNMKKYIKNSLYLFLFCFSACSTPTFKIDSIKAPDYDGSPHKMLLVIDPVFPITKPIETRHPFSEKLAESLKACGVPTFIEYTGQDNNDIVWMIKKFDPDTVLYIHATSKTVTTLTRYGTPISSNVTGAKYEITLTDKTRKKIWKSLVDLENGQAIGNSILPPITYMFADGLVEQMKKDGVLKSCPPKNN